jgi:hypothetical protein
MAEKLDITTLKQDLAERERQRQATEEQRIAEQRRANLDKQAQSEIKKRERRIADLEKSKSFLQRQIFELTQGGKISNEKQLRDAIDGYNASIDLQSELSEEASAIAKGNYTVEGKNIVVKVSRPETGIGQVQAQSLPAGAAPARPEARQQAAKTPLPRAQKTTVTPPGTQVPPAGDQTPPPSKKGDKEKEEKPGKKLSIQEVYDLARTKYGNVDSIFLYEPELQNLIRKAVNQDYEEAQFLRELGATDWAKRGATIYRNREAEKREFEDQLGKLQKQLDLAVDPQKRSAIQEKIDELKTQSNYARGLERAKGIIQNIITQVGAKYTPEQTDLLVRRIYDSAAEGDVNKITNIVSGNIGYASGAVLGGVSGEALTDLRRVAKANGFDLDKVYGSNINDWLGRIAQGESVETFKNVIRQQAKLGLPDKVANLLDQGLDLEQVYAPYRNLMASYLEIPSQNIDLNDKTLRMAIGPDKEMSLYDFERSLRNDSRWEYTNNAREEVSSNVLSVLRSFGFQG